jgi:hypothetical protein
VVVVGAEIVVGVGALVAGEPPPGLVVVGGAAMVVPGEPAIVVLGEPGPVVGVGVDGTVVAGDPGVVGAGPEPIVVVGMRSENDSTNKNPSGTVNTVPVSSTNRTSTSPARVVRGNATIITSGALNKVLAAASPNHTFAERGNWPYRVTMPVVLTKPSFGVIRSTRQLSLTTGAMVVVV